MKRNSFRSTIIGAILLVIGIAAGVLLVQRSQDIRNKANVEPKMTYKICHKDDDDKWVPVEVDRSQLQDYLNKGDILGDCPASESKN